MNEAPHAGRADPGIVFVKKKGGMRFAENKHDVIVAPKRFFINDYKKV